MAEPPRAPAVPTRFQKPRNPQSRPRSLPRQDSRSHSTAPPDKFHFPETSTLWAQRANWQASAPRALPDCKVQPSAHSQAEAFPQFFRHRFRRRAARPHRARKQLHSNQGRTIPATLTSPRRPFLSPRPSCWFLRASWESTGGGERLQPNPSLQLHASCGDIIGSVKLTCADFCRRN